MDNTVKTSFQIPKSLHAAIAKQAEKEGISMNALAIRLLEGHTKEKKAKR